MVTYDFEDEVALVTGGARGQGRCHAVEYAKHGADVAVMDVCEDVETVPYEMATEDELEETVRMVEDEGGNAIGIRGDVSIEADVEEAVDRTIDELGKIDVLANNAGTLSYSPVHEMSEQKWDEMIDILLKGVFFCTKHVTKHLIERGEGGKIVSTSSVSGVVGTPVEASHYVAGKFGVRGLTRSWALELAEYDINVNDVAPSGVDTRMVDGVVEAHGDDYIEAGSTGIGGPYNLFDREKNQVDPMDVTEAFMWLSSDAADHVTGITLPVDGGYLAK